MTTVEYTITLGSDDGTNDGYWNPSWLFTQNIYIGYAYGYRRGFFRFTGVTIPAGATITNAYLSLYAISKTGTPAAIPLYAEDAANPDAPTTYSDANGRTKTTATVNIGTLTTSAWNNITITTIIQELVDSYSYASGAAMQFLTWTATGSGDNAYKIGDYGYSSYPAVLHIEYTSGSAIPVFMNQYRQRWKA